MLALVGRVEFPVGTVGTLLALFKSFCVKMGKFPSASLVPHFALESFIHAAFRGI
jgi:hypothetical protein